jgi:hypothetical protein
MSTSIENGHTVGFSAGFPVRAICGLLRELLNFRQ